MSYYYNRELIANMGVSLRNGIELEKNKLVQDSLDCITNYKEGKKDYALKIKAKDLIDAIMEFRLGLGASKATEYLETNLNWTQAFDYIVMELTEILK